MKVIFLDVDGVLNSQDYYIKHENVDFAEKPFDPTCISCLQTIVKETEAKIVLSSSWRGGWEKDSKKTGLEGSLLNQIFSTYGIEIYDKTPSLLVGKRPLEIIKYMKDCKESIESFLIIDDNDFGWKSYHMNHRVVQTDFVHGGLQQIHIKTCINILNQKDSLKDLLFHFFLLFH